MFGKRFILGSTGESLASEYLTSRGFKIVLRNYRCKFGEIDIIAKDADTLVFIEVKTRSSSRFGSPASAVTLKKQQQISKVASHYLQKENLFDSAIRFDVVSVIQPHSGSTTIELIANAFEYAGF